MATRAINSATRRAITTDCGIYVSPPWPSTSCWRFPDEGNPKEPNEIETDKGKCVKEVKNLVEPSGMDDVMGPIAKGRTEKMKRGTASHKRDKKEGRVDL